MTQWRHHLDSPFGTEQMTPGLKRCCPAYRSSWESDAILQWRNLEGCRVIFYVRRRARSRCHPDWLIDWLSNWESFSQIQTDTETATAIERETEIATLWVLSVSPTSPAEELSLLLLPTFSQWRDESISKAVCRQRPQLTCHWHWTYQQSRFETGGRFTTYELGSVRLLHNKTSQSDSSQYCFFRYKGLQKSRQRTYTGTCG